MASKKFSLKLKNVRIQAGLTQRVVYERLGISQSTFSSWEIGKSEPNADTLIFLCKLYGIHSFSYFSDSVGGNDNVDIIEKKLANDDELSQVKKDFIGFVSTLNDDQIKKVYDLMQTALRLGEK